jgi:hypothetical protein
MDYNWAATSSITNNQLERNVMPKTKRARPNWNGSADAGMNSDPLSSKTNPSYKQVNKEVETCVRAYELLGTFWAPQQCTITEWNQP